MLTIGLTGPSGAGKGTIASLFAVYGIPSVDTDAIYHALLVPPSDCLHELAERFGDNILSADGTLNRKALAALVFAPGHETDLADLNAISHRHVLFEVRRILDVYREQGKPAVLVDAPQLFESGFDAECHHILSVLAPRDIRLARIMARDGLDEERASARLNAQKPDEFYRAHSDAVVYNHGEARAMEADVRRLLTLWEVPYEA